MSGLRDRLYLPEVSPKTGMLQEWMSPDDLGETTHWHLSPLVGCFPGDRINRDDSPADRRVACHRNHRGRRGARQHSPRRR
ncbi:glycosyl hydrolase family 95 catalytic domain-containing protein [Lentzea kristufekii]|uniref:glycosyl hydrolase family 95 catalytic domain-containing protein n=1 Tax=Lentzea kristufekii TaxID=3095430 RepID=UPI0038731385